MVVVPDAQMTKRHTSRPGAMRVRQLSSNVSISYDLAYHF